MAQIDIKNCTILIEDGAGHSLEVKIGEGNLTYSEKRNMLYTLNAGRLDEVREGDQSPMDVKLDAVWEYITGGTSSDGVPTVEDALKQRGAASGWTSTDSDTCRPYAVDVKIMYEPTPEGCGDYEDIVLADLRVEEFAHDLRAGTLSISGKCNVIEAIATRVELISVQMRMMSNVHSTINGVAVDGPMSPWIEVALQRPSSTADYSYVGGYLMSETPTNCSVSYVGGTSGTLTVTTNATGDAQVQLICGSPP